jgi:hypothetical protein
MTSIRKLDSEKASQAVVDEKMAKLQNEKADKSFVDGENAKIFKDLKRLSDWC